MSRRRSPNPSSARPSPPRPSRASAPNPPPASSWKDPLRPQNPLVSHGWILAAITGVVFAALVLGYGALLLLFWQGQWQLLFHPSNTLSSTPASVGLPFQDLRFDPTEAGQNQLDGWWIPAATDAPFTTLTVLYLHGPVGSLSGALPELQALHAADVNVFAFDYRGYGQSAWAHPSEQRWQEDTDAALRYLTETRHLNPHRIILCGAGLAASVAAQTASRLPQILAVILLNPEPPALRTLRNDPRFKLLPITLLSHDRFDPAPALASTSAHKLFVLSALDAEPFYAALAREPKVVLHPIPSPGASPLADAAVQSALRQLFVAVLHSS